MKKLVAGLIAGAAVLALTLITVLLEPTTFLTPRWKNISLTMGIIAILAMAAQAIWTKQDEDAERNEREKLYKQVGKVLNEAKRRRLRRSKASLTPADVAREEAIKKAQALVDFLSSTEPEQKSSVSRLSDLQVHFQHGGDAKVRMARADVKQMRDWAISQLGEELVKALDEGETARAFQLKNEG